MRGMNYFSLAVFTLFVFLSQNIFANGLQNAGFENGLTDWTTESSADVVTVVGSEGPADSTTYSDKNITVDPFIGSFMLRMGAPKNVNEQQNRGDNTVTQEFTATTSSLLFSFRLFSWEHRADDTFSFDLTDSSGASGFIIEGGVSIQMGPGQPATCSATPCVLSIDVGKRQDFLDSGWTKVKLSGLTPGNTYTLKYNLAGGQNEALGSWAYFDNANTPPVAKFDFTTEEIIEGDPVTFNDHSYDPDPGDQVVSWEWTVSGPNFDESIIVEEQNPIFVFPDEGTYTVTLTVTDSFGATDTVSTNDISTDGTAIPSLQVLNEPVLLNALNQEVLAGEEVELIGRFIDPGFLDTHTATWDGDTPASATVLEENIPAIASGLVTGTMFAPALAQTLNGLLTVTDNAGAAANSSFLIQVLDENFDTREPNNSITDAVQLESGWVYLSSIDTLGDIDIFEITLPGGNALEPGSEVLVKLKNLPADYDMVLLSEIPDSLSTSPWLRSPWLRSPFQSAPWLRSPWLRSPWLRSPWLRSPWLRSPWLRSPWLRSPWLRSPWLRSPWLRSAQGDLFMTLDQVPLSELAYSITEGEGIGGTDLDLSELGLEALSTVDGLSVAGFSANRGLEDEELLVRTEFPGTKVYVVIKSNNGSFTPEPYSLQIETSRPFAIENFLGSECNGQPKVPAAASTSSTAIIGTSSSAKTLFVTQKERMQSIYGMDDTAWNAFRDKLLEIAAHPSVNGTVISLPSNIYDGWDINPCDIESVNNTSSAIRDEISGILSSNTGIEYVVLLGSDDMVPFRRVPDETSISNERLYAFDSLLRPGSPLFISAYHGYNLTDDYLVDANPLIWQGRELYVPQISISRLVETPSEIVSVIDNFIVNNGRLDPVTAFVTGYDFFKDGAQLTADNMSGDLTTQTLINDSWSADDIRCQLLGNSFIGTDCGTHDVNAFNAHFNHFGALSAYGFNMEIYDDIVSSTEVAQANTYGPGLKNSINTSLGCHAGLNVPDGSALSNDFSDGTDPNLDFAQAMAQQNALFIASTGYGLGDDTAIAGTERLMALFSEELAMGGAIGHALTAAKRKYVNSVNSFTVYDEKSMIQTVLYGLPMYQVTPSGTIISNPPVANGTPVGSFDLTVEDGTQVTTTTHTLSEVITDNGTYYNASGDHQATAWRPIQPKIVKNVTSAQPVHGVLITAASYTQQSPVNPVISILKQEWQQDTGEEDICLNAFWPSFLTTTNTLETGNGFEQALIVTPGQFRCTSGSGAEVSGIQRLYSSLDLQLLRSSSTDFNAPTVDEVGFRDNGDGSITISVDAVDTSGISRIVILIDYNGAVYSVDSGPISGPSPYSIDVPNFIQDANIIIQIVDGAANVTQWTGKGADAHNIIVDAGEQQVFSNLFPTQLTATIPGFVDLLNESNSVFYRWSFGDDTYDFGRLAEGGQINPIVNIDNQGNASFTVEHHYNVSDDVIASIKIMDAFGGIGIDSVEMRLCADSADFSAINPNLDLIGCAVQNSDATNVSIFLSVAGTIADDMQFRLFVDHSGTAKSSEPDGKPDELLKYQAGNVTGMKSLVVTPLDLNNDNNIETLRFDFDLSEVKWRGTKFQWYAETQDGVQGQPSTGHADVMPDTGYFNYTLR